MTWEGSSGEIFGFTGGFGLTRPELSTVSWGCLAASKSDNSCFPFFAAEDGVVLPPLFLPPDFPPDLPPDLLPDLLPDLAPDLGVVGGRREACGDGEMGMAGDRIGGPGGDLAAGSEGPARMLTPPALRRPGLLFLS